MSPNRTGESTGTGAGTRTRASEASVRAARAPRSFGPRSSPRHPGRARTKKKSSVSPANADRIEPEGMVKDRESAGLEPGQEIKGEAGRAGPASTATQERSCRFIVLNIFESPGGCQAGLRPRSAEPGVVEDRVRSGRRSRGRQSRRGRPAELAGELEGGPGRGAARPADEKAPL